MDIILAICATGLGIFGGMFFIWKGHSASSSKPGSSSAANSQVSSEKNKLPSDTIIEGRQKAFYPVLPTEHSYCRRGTPGEVSRFARKGIVNV